MGQGKNRKYEKGEGIEDQNIWALKLRDSVLNIIENEKNPEEQNRSRIMCEILDVFMDKIENSKIMNEYEPEKKSTYLTINIGSKRRKRMESLQKKHFNSKADLFRAAFWHFFFYKYEKMDEEERVQHIVDITKKRKRKRPSLGNKWWNEGIPVNEL